MTIHLIDRIKDQLTPDVIAGIADGAAESTETTRRAMHAIAPVLLGAVVRFARSTSGGSRLLAIIREGGYDGFDHRELVGQISSPHARTQIKLEGSRLLDRVLGDKRLETTDELGRATGLSAPTAGRLMSLAMPVVMGTIGRVVTDHGLDAPALVDMLADQEPGLSRSMPTAEPPMVARPASEQRRAARSRIPSWLFAAALALLALLVIPQMFPGTTNPFEQDTIVEPGASRLYGDEPEGSETTESETAKPGFEEQGKGKPEGRAVDPAATAVEGTVDDVKAYLEGGEEDVRRFTLRGLRFQPGESKLSAEARTEVDELAELVTSHPNTVLMITGRGDAEDDAPKSRDLATRRARAVSERLVRRGVDSSQVRVLSAGGETGGGSGERAVQITVVKTDQPATKPAPRY